MCQNPKCGRCHKGKCLLDRDLDAEQKSLDFTCKIKGGICAGPTVDAETRAMACANAVSFDNLNEEDNAYSTRSCSLWNPDEAFTDYIRISFQTCFDVKQNRGACLDSGSPVDITNQSKYAKISYGKQV